MIQIPTATEFIKNKFPNHNGVFVLRNIEEFMIEFTKIHVEEALNNAKNSKFKSSIGNSIVEHTPNAKESIINSYPLTNIK